MTLRVTLEIVPFGNEDNKRTIYQLNIENQGSKTKAGRARYKAILAGDRKLTWPITHFRENGALVLASKVLKRVAADLELFRHMGS